MKGVIDVHVLTYDADRLKLELCLDSITHAITYAGIPVSLHVVPGPKGHIGNERARAYGLGNHPYVTCVDDDDWIEASAFSVIGEALQCRPKAVYTKAWGWQNGKRLENNLRQHLRVFRRQDVSAFDFSTWAACDSSALMAYIDTLPGETMYLNDRVYHYRIDPNSRARRILRSDRDLIQRADALGNVHAWPEAIA